MKILLTTSQKGKFGKTFSNGRNICYQRFSQSSNSNEFQHNEHKNIHLLQIAVDAGCKLNLYETFRRHSESLLNVLCTFHLRPVSTGICIGYSFKRSLKWVTVGSNAVYFILSFQILAWIPSFTEVHLHRKDWITLKARRPYLYDCSTSFLFLINHYCWQFLDEDIWQSHKNSFQIIFHLNHGRNNAPGYLY